MKIIAAVNIGRNGRQYKAGDSLDVSPAHARMYVLSKQARYATEVVTPAATVRKTPAAPVAPERKPVPRTPQPDAPQRETQQEDKPPRKGRHRRRDMRAEGDE